MRIQKKVTLYKKICKWKTSLTSQANGSKKASDLIVGPFKGQFSLVC